MYFAAKIIKNVEKGTVPFSTFYLNDSSCFFIERSASLIARMATGRVMISTMISMGMFSMTGIISWS